ncbi:MAG: DNA methylase [Planctomycetes bacterium]|nr:DNA methylase [Planctomycetota bacterium]
MRNPLHSLCPYFAMFPEDFVREQVDAYTAPGDCVFDPFSGRGTTIFQSLLMDRRSAGVDVNPVAYCISGAKAELPSLSQILDRIDKLESLYAFCDEEKFREERRTLPPFFRRAYYHTTLNELLFLRLALNWQSDPVDRFVTALALGCLHGEVNSAKSYFSNQMPRTISTKPQYSLKYWKKKKLWPQKRNVFAMLRIKAGFRLSGAIPSSRGQVRLADARKSADEFPHLKGQVSVIVTSPPYFDVTNYEEDQWLRLWLLGFDPKPSYSQFSHDSRHTQEDHYWRFLQESWKGIKPLLKENATIVCRMGAKGLTEARIRERMVQSVQLVFPEAKMPKRPVISNIRNSQTRAFRPGSKGCLFEMDFVFSLSG